MFRFYLGGGPLIIDVIVDKQLVRGSVRITRPWIGPDNQFVGDVGGDIDSMGITGIKVTEKCLVYPIRANGS